MELPEKVSYQDYRNETKHLASIESCPLHSLYEILFFIFQFMWPLDNPIPRNRKEKRAEMFKRTSSPSCTKKHIFEHPNNLIKL